MALLVEAVEAGVHRQALRAAAAKALQPIHSAFLRYMRILLVVAVVFGRGLSAMTTLALPAVGMAMAAMAAAMAAAGRLAPALAALPDKAKPEHVEVVQAAHPPNIMAAQQRFTVQAEAGVMEVTAVALQRRVLAATGTKALPTCLFQQRDRGY